jgi:PKD repeat protein
VNFSSAGAGGAFNGLQVIWDALTIPPASHLTLALTVTVAVPLPDATILINQVHIVGGGAAFDLPTAAASTQVYNPPQAAFEASPTLGTLPLNVTFSNNSEHATIYCWDFGDGTIDYSASPSHLYLETGLYNVTLTASNPGGSDTLIRVGYIVVVNYMIVLPLVIGGR